jgi:hypothetical protein
MDKVAATVEHCDPNSWLFMRPFDTSMRSPKLYDLEVDLLCIA